MVANFLLVIFLVVLGTTVFGIIRFKSIFSKLLITSLIDSTGLIILSVALILKTGVSPMAYKVLTVLVFILLTNPIINHMITRSAYNELKEKDQEDDAC